jgi:transposase
LQHQRFPLRSNNRLESQGVLPVLRRKIKERGALANIPTKANRTGKTCFSSFLSRNRNAIERTLCRLKDFRRIVAHCDRSAANFLAAVSIAAAAGFWLCVRTQGSV